MHTQLNRIKSINKETKLRYATIFRQNEITRRSFDLLTNGSNDIAASLKLFMEELGVNRKHIDQIKAECAQCKFILSVFFF